MRNPNWDHATDYKPAYLDSIDVREGNKDTTVASRQVLSGSHMASGEFPVPGPVIKQALQTNKDQLAFVPTGGIDYIPLNTAIPPFNDINLRKAVIALATMSWLASPVRVATNATPQASCSWSPS